jgi:type I restriction enzyme, S subunit
MPPSLPDGTTAARGLPPPEQIRWPLVASRDLFELRYGKALVESSRRPGHVPVYGTNGRCGSHDEALFKGPGVILGRKGQGPLGVEWCDGDYWVIDTAYALATLRPDVDLRYAYYLIKFVGLNHLKDGTSNPTLSRGSFGAQAFPLPPVDHQRAIAHILGTLDGKIQLNRRMSETLEALGRALFKSWFVDFEPVRVRVDNRGPCLPAPIADMFPVSLAESEVGEIPVGWEVKRVSDLAEIVGGTTPSTRKPEFWERGVHAWATPKDLSRLSVPVLLDTERRISDSGLSQIGSGLLPIGTVLLSSRAPIGYLAIAQVPVAINQGFIGMIPRAGTPSAFLLLWATSAHDEIVSRANGSTFLEISKSNFRPIPVVVPPAEIMRSFDEIVSPLYRRVVQSELNSRALAALRDTLLPKLISGELRIADAESFVGGSN